MMTQMDDDLFGADGHNTAVIIAVIIGALILAEIVFGRNV